jgi:hypothetical protein
MPTETAPLTSSSGTAICGAALKSFQAFMHTSESQSPGKFPIHISPNDLPLSRFDAEGCQVKLPITVENQASPGGLKSTPNVVSCPEFCSKQLF